MSLEKELAELKAKQAEKEAELIREHGILKHFAEFEEYGRPMVHFYKLYGRRGSVHFNWQRYESIAKGKNPDAELLRRLLEKFPGEPKVMYRDGCVGFRDEGNAIAAKAKAEERGLKAEITDVEPVTVKIDPAHYSQSVKFEWLTMLDGELWEIEVEYPIYRTSVGKLTLRFDYWRQGGHESEVRRILECDFQPHTGQRIRYSRVDEKTPNLFVVYWLQSLQKPDYPSMVKEAQS